MTTSFKLYIVLEGCLKKWLAKFAPDELEDAAVPDHHHLPEALARPLRVLVPVGKHVGPILRHFDALILSLLTHCILLYFKNTLFAS